MAAIRELRYIIRDGGTLRGRTFSDGHRDGYLYGSSNELLAFNKIPTQGPVPEYMQNVPDGTTFDEAVSNFRQRFCGYSNPDINSAEAKYWYMNMIFFSFDIGGPPIIEVTRPSQSTRLVRRDTAKDGMNILRDGVRAELGEG